MREKVFSLRKKALNSLPFVCAGTWFFWEPDYIKTQLGILDTVFDAGAVVFILIGTVFYMACREEEKKRSTRLFHVILIGMAAVMLFSTIYHSGLNRQVWKCIKYLYPIVGAVLLLEQAAFENFENAVRAVYFMTWAQTLLNFVTVFAFSKGLYRGTDREPQYFLGNENLFFMTILPALCTGCILAVEKGGKLTWDTAILWAAAIASVLKVWSAGTLTGIFLFGILLLAIRFLPFDSLFRLITGITVAAAGFVSVVLLKLQNLFKPIIVDVLHKDLTLTRRTILWELIFEAITASPLIGYGVETAEQFSARVGGDTHWVHAHDYYLELMMKGGIVLLILFLVLLFLTAASLDSRISDSRAKVLSISIFVFLVCFIGDCYEMRTTFYMILTLSMVFGCCGGTIKDSGKNPEGSRHIGEKI